MVNSGSSANYLAIELLGLPHGAEVITPALTFATTVAPLVKNGLVPAFVDVEPDTFNIDAEQVEAMIGPNTKAMMVPSLIGNLPDWDRLAEIAAAHELLVVEDSADTLGATLRGASTGTRSHISTTSFYGSHVINCAGNGGMLCVNDEALADEARLLRSWGRSSSLFVDSEDPEKRFGVTLEGIEYDAKFVFERIGYNLEPSEIGAAFGLVQLGRLQSNIDARIANFDAHLNFFADYENWFVLPRQCPESRTGWLALPLIVREDAPFTRRELQTYLEGQGIQTRTVFTGNILRQPGYRDIVGVRRRAAIRTPIKSCAAECSSRATMVSAKPISLTSTTASAPLPGSGSLCASRSMGSALPASRSASAVTSNICCATGKSSWSRAKRSACSFGSR